MPKKSNKSTASKSHGESLAHAVNALPGRNSIGSPSDDSRSADDALVGLALANTSGAVDAERCEEFWSLYLSGYERPGVRFTEPGTGPRPAEQPARGEESLRLSHSFSSQAHEFCRRRGLRLQTLLEGAWALVVHRLTGDNDLVFGCSPVSCEAVCNRCHECAASPFRGVPVRVAIEEHTTTVDWLRMLQQATNSAMEHAVSSELIQQWSGLPIAEPLFDTRVVMTQVVPLESILNSSTDPHHGQPLDAVTAPAPEVPECPYVLRVTRGDAVNLTLEFDMQFLDRSTALRILAHLEQMLFAIVSERAVTLQELPNFSTDEMHRMLANWNATAAEYDRLACLHELFERQAATTPDAPAVLDDMKRLTYAELNEHANQLAHHLKSLGIRPGQYVGVYMQRGLEMIPAVLGILKAGGAYVPIEPSVPAARVQWILNSLDIPCVVTQPSLRGTLLDWSPELRKLANVVCLDLGHSQYCSGETPEHHEGLSETAESRGAPRVWMPSDLANYPLQNLEVPISSEQDAYVIFTSGSTGTPKGVRVAHQPVINLIEWVNRTFEVGPSDRLLFVTSLSFDLSVYDIFGILAAGGSIRVACGETVRNPEKLWTVLSSEPITFWDSAPPTLQQLAPQMSESQPLPSSSLRLVFLSGDWISVSLPDEVRRVFPRAEVVSLGGATEATVWSNYHRIGTVDRSWKSIPYGRPIQNAEYYILDEQMRPCPVGVTGELFIGGECLARGYTDPERTALAFVEHTLGNRTTRLYRTGDLARFQPDGVMELIGRIDFQVKIRGFRVELGEIEHVILQQPGVREALVMALGDSSLDKRVVAYVVPTDMTLSVQMLRTNLRKRLPGYMVPSAFVVLERMPLNSSGKIDRHALPAPSAQAHAADNAYVAPRSGLEVTLTRMWERLLDIQPIGVTDNFFDLGGHSMLAVRLQHTLEGYLQRPIPLATVLQAPTIEQLASSLEQYDCPTPHQSLAIIQPGANRPPLFCLHVLGRGLEFFRPLVHHVDRDLPIYGLSTEFLRPEEAPRHDVPSLASFYAQEIKAIQPQGPYYLAGLSFGGVVAFEVARQLRNQGDTVALLALLDTRHPQPGNNPEVNRGLDHVSNLLAHGEVKLLWKKLHSRWRSKRNQWAYRLRILRCLLQKRLRQELVPNDFDFMQRRANEAAARDYRPRDYKGPVTLFKATEINRQEASKESGWREVAIGGMEVIPVPGGHLTMMQEPCVQTLGKLLMECLQKADQDLQHPPTSNSTNPRREASLIRRRPTSSPPIAGGSLPSKTRSPNALVATAKPATDGSPSKPLASEANPKNRQTRPWIKNPSFCR